MKKEEFYENYPFWIILVSNLVSIEIYVIGAFIIYQIGINWLIQLFSSKRNRSLANFCEPWNTETYKYVRYLTAVSNVRPFPFSDVERMSKFER